jgi:hypothetical protein
VGDVQITQVLKLFMFLDQVMNDKHITGCTQSTSGSESHVNQSVQGVSRNLVRYINLHNFSLRVLSKFNLCCVEDYERVGKKFLFAQNRFFLILWLPMK